MAAGQEVKAREVSGSAPDIPTRHIPLPGPLHSGVAALPRHVAVELPQRHESGMVVINHHSVWGCVCETVMSLMCHCQGAQNTSGDIVSDGVGVDPLAA